MSGHHATSKFKISEGGRTPPNVKNTRRIDVDVEGGTVEKRAFACSGCGDVRLQRKTRFVVAAKRLKTGITTKYGSLYHYVGGPARGSGTRSWPYCSDCYETLRESVFSEAPAVRKKTVDGEPYQEAACASCETRQPAKGMRPFVLRPTKAVHKNGGPGMTAPSYPKIHGKAVLLLCDTCYSEFVEDWQNEYEVKGKSNE